MNIINDEYNKWDEYNQWDEYYLTMINTINDEYNQWWILSDNDEYSLSDEQVHWTKDYDKSLAIMKKLIQ